MERCRRFIRSWRERWGKDECKSGISMIIDRLFVTRLDGGVALLLLLLVLLLLLRLLVVLHQRLRMPRCRWRCQWPYLWKEEEEEEEGPLLLLTLTTLPKCLWERRMAARQIEQQLRRLRWLG